MIKDYIWITDQHEKKDMRTMTNNELQKAYNHCNDMLYNNDSLRKGRYYMIKQLNHEVIKCNAELAVRWFLALNDGKDYSRYRIVSIINGLKVQDYDGMISDNDLKKLTLNDIFATDSIPADFRSLDLFNFRAAALGFGGKCSIYHFNPKMIQKIGVKFDTNETNALNKLGFISVDEKVEYAKKCLGFNKLFLSNKGLTITQFESILSTNKESSYEQLSSEQLLLLRDKVINEIIEVLKKEITSWENIRAQIEEVAKEKNFILQ